MRKENSVIESTLWSIALPGFTQILNGQLIKDIGFDGFLRAGPRLKTFEKQYTAFAGEINRNKRKKLAQEIDQ